MRYARAGRPRRITDSQVRMIREWKPFSQLIREIGIGETHAGKIRRGLYKHKQRSP